MAELICHLAYIHEGRKGNGTDGKEATEKGRETEFPLPLLSPFGLSIDHVYALMEHEAKRTKGSCFLLVFFLYLWCFTIWRRFRVCFMSSLYSLFYLVGASFSV